MSINKETDKLKNYYNPIGEICLRKDRILTFEPNKNVTQTNINVLKSDLVTFIEWTKDSGPLPFLSDNRPLKQMSSEERLFIQAKVPLFASKIAIIVSGGLSSFFYNIMAHLNKPEIPMKAFTDINKAFIWLKEN